jgi:hypothetical protein
MDPALFCKEELPSCALRKDPDKGVFHDKEEARQWIKEEKTRLKANPQKSFFDR